MNYHKHTLSQATAREPNELASGSPFTGAWVAFATGLVRFDHRRVAPWLGVRSAATVGLLLAAGLLLDAIPEALVATIGALNVAMSDSHEPYKHRIRRLLVACFLGGLGVFVGSAAGLTPVLVVPVLFAWAFASGLSVAVSTAAADLGRTSLATLIIFGAYPLPVDEAAVMAALAISGGLLLTAFAAASWPLRRHAAERRALHSLYKQLAALAAVGAPAVASPAAANELVVAHRELSGLSFDRSMQSQRLRALLTEAERLRIDLLTLHRLHRRMRRYSGAEPHADSVRASLELGAKTLLGIARSFLESQPPHGMTSSLNELQAQVSSINDAKVDTDHEFKATLADGRALLDTFSNHLRTAVDYAANATLSGLSASLAQEARKPRRLRIGGGLATLRANLSLRSAAFRHAIRLACAAALAAGIGFAADLPRPHWMVIATALVLMPDFATTFSRGVLRLAGTLVGLVLATALLVALPASLHVQAGLVIALVFILRSLGSANHGLYVLVGTALVVALLALSGIEAEDVIVVRGANTVMGGGLALLVYWFWPTWERTQTNESLAAMLDAYRRYFRTVWTGIVRPELAIAAELNQARQAARRTRSNVDASLERMKYEPASTAAMKWLDAALPASHRFIHACLALEAVLSNTARIPAGDAHTEFAKAVELTLYQLTDALRGLSIRRADLPDLRLKQSQLLKSGDSLIERYALVNVEVDRLSSSLESLSAHVLGYVASQRHRSADRDQLCQRKESRSPESHMTFEKSPVHRNAEQPVVAVSNEHSTIGPPGLEIREVKSHARIQ